MAGKPSPNNRGRKPGARNRSTIERELRAASGVQLALDGGPLPLDILLRVMRGDDGISDRQFAAAVAAAPYVHPKLATTTVNATVNRNARDLTDDELLAFIDSQAGENDDEAGLAKPH